MKGSSSVDIITATITQTKFDDTVDNILKRPEYKTLTSGITDLIDKIKQYLMEKVADLFSKAFKNVKPSAALADKVSTIIIIITILLIAAIVILVIVKINKKLNKKARIKEILGEKIDENDTPETLKEKAKKFQEQGDYRQAIRFDFISLLFLMHTKSIVYLDQTKTNDEIYNYLKNSNFSNLEKFNILIKVFNFTWYGHNSSSKEMFENWENNIDTIWNEVIKYEEKGKR